MLFQLLPVDSFATKVVHGLAKNQAFLWVGWASWVSLVTFGLLMSYIHGTVQAVRYINGATGLAALCAVRKRGGRKRRRNAQVKNA